jgi:large subunit ribosomal protein L19
MKTDLMKAAEQAAIKMDSRPDFKAGDTVTVYYKIIEGNKEREQQFQGVVLQRKGHAATQTFTVRKISNGIGVERIFPLFSPKISKIEVNKRGSVRRARIFYLRDISGKAARIEEKKVVSAEETTNNTNDVPAKSKSSKQKKTSKTPKETEETVKS